jgi:GAF domain-containing protein
MEEKELEALLRISTALSSTNSRQEMLRLLLRETAEVVGGVIRCSVIVADESRPTASVVATYENPSPSI